MSKSIYTKSNQDLSAWLRKQRENNALSTRDFAALLKESHSKVVRIELGQQMIDVIQFVRWCLLLHANPSEVLGPIWLNEMNELAAKGAPTWENVAKAAEPKPVTYAPRRKAKPGA